MKNVKIELDRDNTALVIAALKWAADLGDARVASGEADDDPTDNSTGRLRWVAEYMTHKLRDAGY